RGAVHDPAASGAAGRSADASNAPAYISSGTPEAGGERAAVGLANAPAGHYANPSGGEAEEPGRKSGASPDAGAARPRAGADPESFGLRGHSPIGSGRDGGRADGRRPRRERAGRNRRGGEPSADTRGGSEPARAAERSARRRFPAVPDPGASRGSAELAGGAPRKRANGAPGESRDSILDCAKRECSQARDHFGLGNRRARPGGGGRHQRFSSFPPVSNRIQGRPHRAAIQLRLQYSTAVRHR